MILTARNEEDKMSVTAHNPILPGFYPDPSICAAGEDFYLVNSTFAYFPGLPVMHSRDLAHWEQVGNACSRPSQLPLKGAGHSQGLFAPTIRYHDGTFYVICTNVTFGGNFIVTARDPAGPWSEPHYIRGAEGIDPSLFFDTDGRCYYIGTRPNRAGCQYNGDWYIWMQELDLSEMKLVGEAKDLWNGSQKNVIWPEGPHLYYKDGYYYILHAEGGTGPWHAVAVCRSRNLWGPYENNPCNPILTHRHLGKDYPVRYVGHGDLVRTVNGEWYLVMLAVRPREGYTVMGRETFLARVVWEDDWPIVNPGEGKLTEEVEIDLPEWEADEDPRSWRSLSGGKNALPGSSRCYDFTDMERLGDEFLLLRNPDADMYRLEKGKGLYLRLGKETLMGQGSPSFAAIRQQHHSFLATVALAADVVSGDPGDGLTAGAGLVLLQNNLYHLRMEVSARGVRVILCENGIERDLGESGLSEGMQEALPVDAAGEARRMAAGSKELVLYLQVEGLKAQMGWLVRGEKRPVAEKIDIRRLSTEVSGGFVGCTVGMYAVGAQETDACARFTRFAYEAL